MVDSIMVATLGGQPQIVTFALDALLAQGENIHEVIVLYLAAEGSRVNRALAKLAAEFSDDHYAGRPCRLRPMPIRDGLERVPDIRSKLEADITWDMLCELLMSLKRERHRLHVCVSGGRRIMALVLASVATVHFGQSDKLWHVYTPDELQERAEAGALMHAQPTDGVRLIEVPLISLGIPFSAVRQAPQPANREPHHLPQQPDATDRTACQQVWDQLKERPRQVLRLLAAGQHPQEVADSLTISIKTLDSHKTAIFAECRVAWGMADGQWLDYHFLREKFGPFVTEF